MGNNMRPAVGKLCIHAAVMNFTAANGHESVFFYSDYICRARADATAEDAKK